MFRELFLNTALSLALPFPPTSTMQAKLILQKKMRGTLLTKEMSLTSGEITPQSSEIQKPPQQPKKG
ncbi:hypothetical protein TNCV_880991 [Trichonephila clavipes]|nr:hypothetical protein TNCV_880991 [Trichonephila clavipes]